MFDNNNLEMVLFHSKYVKHKDYWSKKLAGEIIPTSLLMDYDKKTGPPALKEMTVPMPPDLGQKIITMCKNSDLSLYIMLLSSLKILIYRYMSREDIIVSSPINKNKATGETLSRFLFIRDQVAASQTARELILNVRKSVCDAYDNQDYPTEKIMNDLFPSTSVAGENPRVISNVLCCLENLHDMEGINLEELNIHYFFRFLKTDGQLTGKLFYGSNICTQSEAKRLSEHFCIITAAIGENVNQKVKEIPVLSEREKEQLLVEFNSNRGDFSSDRTICHFIEDYAVKTPEAVALKFQNEETSYLQLNRRVDGLAMKLRAGGVDKDSLVIILMKRSSQMVESILAVWKAGGAYIPLDPDYPVQRVFEILRDSGAQVVITESRYINSQFEESCTAEIIIVDKQENVKQNEILQPDHKLNMRSLAYIIYTSGSTGRPKGVMVEHIGMMNHIAAKVHDLQLTEASIIAQNASHTFDISIWQFFTALTLGGKTVIYPDEVLLEPVRFISQIIKERVTILEVVPSYLAIILEFFESNRDKFEFLRYLLVTGEIVIPRLVKNWFAKFPAIKMVNAYGPTEASDDITHYVMDKAPEGDRISIGKPVQNMNIYIVDKNMNLCPPGVKGEICVSGVGVGRGYLNDVEKNARHFLEDPFCGEPGIRLYRTGDIGCFLEDGRIDFFGRNDYQVKINGFRIELGEIENTLLRHDAVRQAVVLVKNENGKDPYLVAFQECTSDIPVQEIREFLSRELPYYMVPSYFLQLEVFPLTPNGKIDRRALSNIFDSSEKQQGVQNYIAPRNEMEQRLADLWQEVLEVEKIGITDDFFAIGGDSFKAIRLVAKYGKGLMVPDIYTHPTIEGLSGFLMESDGLGRRYLHQLTKSDTAGEIAVICIPNSAGEPVMFMEVAEQFNSFSDKYTVYGLDLPREEPQPGETTLSIVQKSGRGIVDEIKANIKIPVVLYSQCNGVGILLEVTKLLEEEEYDLRAICIGVAHPRLRLRPEEDNKTDEERMEFMQNLGASIPDDPVERVILFRNWRYDRFLAIASFNSCVERIKEKTFKKFKTPLFSIIGEKDPLTPNYEKRYKNWKNYAESVELVVIEDAGHYLARDKAVELAVILYEIAENNYEKVIYKKNTGWTMNFAKNILKTLPGSIKKGGN